MDIFYKLTEKGFNLIETGAILRKRINKQELKICQALYEGNIKSYKRYHLSLQKLYNSNIIELDIPKIENQMDFSWNLKVKELEINMPSKIYLNLFVQYLLEKNQKIEIKNNHLYVLDDTEFKLFLKKFNYIISDDLEKNTSEIIEIKVYENVNKVVKGVYLKNWI